MPIVQDVSRRPRSLPRARLPLVRLQHRRKCRHLQGDGELGHHRFMAAPRRLQPSRPCPEHRRDLQSASDQAEASNDPCAGEEPGASFERVRPHGRHRSPVRQHPREPLRPGSHALIGGNPLLCPEVGDTITAGLVWTPRSITGLSFTLDYYDIEITDAITAISADYILGSLLGHRRPFLLRPDPPRRTGQPLVDQGRLHRRDPSRTSAR